mgnify:CR=1 FL=1
MWGGRTKEMSLLWINVGHIVNVGQPKSQKHYSAFFHNVASTPINEPLFPKTKNQFREDKNVKQNIIGPLCVQIKIRD